MVTILLVYGLSDNLSEVSTDVQRGTVSEHITPD